MPALHQPFDHIQITEVSDGPFFIGELFRRKFNDTAPAWGHSVIAFFREEADRFRPLCYTNFLPHSGVILVGGAMTDGNVMRALPADLRDSIVSEGGIYLAVLRYAFARFAEECDAYFGYAADERALEVDLKAGFEHTGHDHLIAHFHKPLSPRRRRRLIEKIHAIGPF